MIKLVTTDIDGTLVKDASPEIYPEMIEMIKYLRSQDVIVCIASGRQSSSIARMFKEVADDLIFIADNGAHIRCRGTDIHVARMDEEVVKELVEELRPLEGCEKIFEAPGLTYTESKNPEFINFLKKEYRVNLEQVDDVLKEGKDIIKVSIFNRPSIRKMGEEVLIPKWSDRLKAVMAGEDWVDFMDKSVDKGYALEFVQNFFHITPEETMVFGDNNNDIGMLKRAKESYAVSTAPEVVKQSANHICGSWMEKGVYQVLKEYFNFN